MSTASTSTVPNPESSSSLSGKNGKATTTILVPTPTPTPTPAPPPPSLERKFELLEARFTQPLGLFGHQTTHSISPTGNHHQQQQQQQQQQHQQNDQHSDGSEHSFRFSGNNNNNSSNNSNNSNNSNSNSNSNRSRGTMTVRSKRNSSGSLRQMTSLDMVHRAAAEHMRKVASSSPLLGLPGSSTLSVVATHANATLAHAHAHANAPSTTSPSPTASPASNFSLSGSPNNSQQTVVTGNRTHQRGGTTTSASSVAATATPPRQQSNTDNNNHNNNNNNNTETNDAERVVAESPPVLISPAKASTATTTTTATATARTKPSVARALPISQTQPKPGSGSATKRKSVPKRKISSINDTLLGQATSPIKPIAHNNNNTTTNNNNNNNHNNTAAATASRSPRPNHNFNHNHNHNNNNHNNNNNSTNLFSEHSRDRSNNSNIGGGGGSNNHHNKKPRILLPPANNKRIHDFFSSTTKKKVLSSSSLAATGSSSSLNANTANANTNANANTTTTHHPPAPSVAPINHNKTGTSGNTGKTTNTNTKNSAPNTTAAATNNTAASVAATTATTTVVHPQPLVSSRRGRAGSASTTTATATATSTATASTSIAPATTPSPSPAADQAALLRTAHAKTEHWQSKCAKLQQQLQDTNEQLRAVTGNKTILHTALQQALTKTRTELVTLRETTAARTQKLHSVLEDALRWRFENEAKELREALGADGNRLGRIVSTRAGMRVIDTWEEGHAARDWQLRREKWRRKRTALLAKQDALRKRLDAQKLKQIMQAQHGQQAQQARNQAEGDAPTTTGAPSPSSATTTATTTSATPVDDDPPLTDLEIEEAKESIQMHIEALLREEKELLAEEQTLNDEKGAHIRALKRVASEDASRFKNRAKLHDRYVPDRLLGKGGFSEVWKAYDLQELREVAVKIHQLDPRWPDVKKENYTKHVSREYEIHRNVRHPRIVSLYDVFEIDNNSFATVLECCHGTDLDTLLKRKKRLPERQARAILLQILSGMRYLSQPAPDGSRQGIIHYDLKPGNILFDEFGDAKITDFGLSKIVDTPDPAESMELTSQGAGTYWYLPPECFVTGEQVRISNKVDVWSIGVIFYQMLYGQRPFGEGKSQDKLLADHTMLNAQEVHLPDKPAVSDAGKEFVQQCLVYDQAFRPTIAQLCDHPYALQSGV